MKTLQSLELVFCPLWSFVQSILVSALFTLLKGHIAKVGFLLMEYVTEPKRPSQTTFPEGLNQYCVL
jgi:hypothetical protein